MSGAFVARRVGGHDVPPSTADQAQARALDLLGSGREAALVLIYVDPSGRLVEVLERTAAGKTLPAGETKTVRSVPAVIDQQKLSFVEQMTLIEGNLSTGVRRIDCASRSPA